MERSKMEKNLEQLKHSIATGEMTGSELVRRLQMMIQHEISKPEKEVDTEFIEACSSLIEIVYPDITKRPEGYYEEQEAKFKLRLRQREKARKRQRISRPAIAVAAVLVIVFLSVGSLRFHWFTAESTPDQQQLIIQGHEVSVDMVAKAIAEHQEEGYFETSDINELDKYLGFSVSKQMIKFDSWRLIRLTCSTSPISIIASFEYKNDVENKSIVQFITWFSNAENALLSFEQNAEGNIEDNNGVNVYFMSNYDYNTCIWIDNVTVYTFSSNTLQMEELELLMKDYIRSE